MGKVENRQAVKCPFHLAGSVYQIIFSLGVGRNSQATFPNNFSFPYFRFPQTKILREVLKNPHTAPYFDIAGPYLRGLQALSKNTQTQAEGFVSVSCCREKTRCVRKLLSLYLSSDLTLDKCEPAL